jgi:hypothetical protein
MDTGYKLSQSRVDAGQPLESGCAKHDAAGFSEGGKKMRVRKGMRGNSIVSLGLLAASLLAVVPQSRGQENLAGQRVFRVRLTAPVSSDSTPGSKVAAQVVSPEGFAGDIMEGEIVKAHSSGRADQKSVLMFTFSKLYHGTGQIEVDGKIMRSYNSKGQENIDEQGYVVSQGGSGLLGKFPKGLPGGLPAAIPRWPGRGNNKKVEIALEVAALVISYTAKAPKISFDTDSQFEIELVQR